MHLEIAQLTCTFCDNNQRERLAQVTQAWGATDATKDGAFIIQAVDQIYGGVFQRLGRVLDGREHLPEWMFRKGPSHRVRLRFAFVDGPISNVACCFRVPIDSFGTALPCDQCGYENRTVVLNVRFSAFVSHMLANVGLGIPSATPLHDLLAAMLATDQNYLRLPAPLEVDRTTAFAGIGVVLSHELGHVFTANVPEMDFEGSDIPAPFRKHILSELDADRQSIRILTAAQTVLSPFDLEGPVHTFVGAEAVERALHIIGQHTAETDLPFDALPLVTSEFYPTPRLRWQAQKEVGELMVQLGLMNGDLWKQTMNFFNNPWERSHATN